VGQAQYDLFVRLAQSFFFSVRFTQNSNRSH